MSHSNSQNFRLAQAAAYLQISKTSLWRLQNNDPDFPTVIRLSARCCVFRKSDLDAYLTAKKEV